MIKIAMLFVLAWIAFVGWTISEPLRIALPAIPRHHWERNIVGAELFDDKTGDRSGSFVLAGFSAAQFCPFDRDDPCKRFDSNERTLAYAKSVYEKAK